MPELSVVIITFNEERNIARCIESVQGIADDIVVVDSFSTDATKTICERYGVNFVQRNWDGYSKTKNFANTQAEYDFVLSMDADEALSETLIESIKAVKKHPAINTCYSFNRLTNYCGSWIHHCGWYPDKKVRLFNRKIAIWQGDIHENLQYNDTINIVNLRGDCLHYSYYSVEQHYAQVDKFTDLLAKDHLRSGKGAGILKLYISPVFKFLRNYIFKLGFLDGVAGYIICRISAYATYLKYKKMRSIIHSN